MVSVYDGEDLIGMTRVLSDGLNDTCITDVIVRPGYQGQGIGRAMMETVMHTFAHTALYVSCLTGSEGFFLKCGLKQQSRLKALAVKEKFISSYMNPPSPNDLLKINCM